MKIECTVVEEHDDGSATLTIDTDKEGTEFLVSYAVSDILEQAWNHALERQGSSEVPVKPRKRVRVTVDEQWLDSLPEAPL